MLYDVHGMLQKETMIETTIFQFKPKKTYPPPLPQCDSNHPPLNKTF